jgi:hypothetical protein
LASAIRGSASAVARRAPWLDEDVVLAVAEVLCLVLPAAKTYWLRHVLILTALNKGQPANSKPLSQLAPGSVQLTLLYSPGLAE